MTERRRWQPPRDIPGDGLLTSQAEAIWRRVLTERGEHIEAYIRAYLRETGTPMAELELCEQHDRDGTIRWFFRQRQPAP